MLLVSRDQAPDMDLGCQLSSAKPMGLQLAA